jgi:hypothetical protein
MAGLALAAVATLAEFDELIDLRCVKFAPQPGAAVLT